MGKHIEKKEEESQEEEKGLDQERYESDLVKLKKENQKAMEKAVSQMESKVKQEVKAKQIVMAIKALQKFAQQKSKGIKNLLADENEDIHLGFTLTKVPSTPSPRPLQIKIPHPFNCKANDTRVCVIVKDPESAFRKQIEDLDIPCIAEVIGFDRLRRDFRQFKDKRQLLKDYDLFLADIRIYKMLPEMLGKEFYAKKAFPCPIKLHGLGNDENLKTALNQAAECAYFI